MAAAQDPRPDVQALAASFRRVRARGFSDDNAVILHDLDRLRQRLRRIQAAFPANALHSLAIKANPLVEVLAVARAEGFGLEAASFEEVRLALAAGCDPGKVLYDSPAKTRDELTHSLRLGLRLQADSFEELERIAQTGLPSRAPIGLRVNPEVGAGQIAMTSVATAGSRFGVSIRERQRIIDAFRGQPGLRALHVHVGSQGCTVEQLIDAVERIDRLRQEIDAALGAGTVGWVNLGGGLPAVFSAADPLVTPESYASALRGRCPALFSPTVGLLTEFGRWIQASCGTTVSRVEYVKDLLEPTATLHVGADLFVRRAYRPEAWTHEFVALDPSGNVKEGHVRPWTLVGPLCFSGDVLARGAPLCDVAPGDHILVRDTGAYTLGMWSRHCSRGIPAVVGIENGDVRLLRRRETPEDIVALWSREPR